MLAQRIWLTGYGASLTKSKSDLTIEFSRLTESVLGRSSNWLERRQGYKNGFGRIFCATAMLLSGSVRPENPKALQLHLGHSSALMTMRYLATLTAEDALRIQQQVEFGRPK